MVRLPPVTRRRMVWLVVLLLLAGLAFWYFWILEWEEYEVDMGYGEQARRNPYLAAQQFLEERGHSVQVLKTFTALDTLSYKEVPVGPQDLVILVNARGALGDERVARLWRWLEGGGSLVLSGRNSFMGGDQALSDSLFARLDVDLASLSPATSTEAEADGGDPVVAEEDSCSQLTATRIEVVDGPDFELAQLGRLGFVPPGERVLAWRDDAHPARFLRFRQGAGSVTLSADNRIWDNARIGCFDHAYSLGVLAAGREAVWVLINANSPSLWRVLWRAVPLAVVAFTLALLLWLWARGKRFAPAVPRKAVGRRSFLEHLHASAVFLWRHHQGQRLVVQMRQDLLRDLAHRFPGFHDESSAQQLALVSRRSGLPSDETRRAITGPLPTTPADFALVVSHLQHIRNQL